MDLTSDTPLAPRSGGGAERWFVRANGGARLDLMQDYLGYVAISAAVGDVIRGTIPTVLAEYGICVSMSKRAEDEAAIEGVQV